MDVNDRIPAELLELEVRGRGLEPGATFGDLLRSPTLLVFLRHFG
jgi:hypothetical protein